MTPTLRDLCEEQADRRDECGLVDNESICVKPKKHEGPHQFVEMRRVIPIN